MKRLKATMKIYPVDEKKPGQHWSESYKHRLITVRLMNGIEKPENDIANAAFQALLGMGFGALDYNTYGKIVKIEDLHAKQVELNKLLSLTLTM